VLPLLVMSFIMLSFNVLAFILLSFPIMPLVVLSCLMWWCWAWEQALLLRCNLIASHGGLLVYELVGDVCRVLSLRKPVLALEWKSLGLWSLPWRWSIVLGFVIRFTRILVFACLPNASARPHLQPYP
jgi:hypothetical protein